MPFHHEKNPEVRKLELWKHDRGFTCPRTKNIGTSTHYKSGRNLLSVPLSRNRPNDILKRQRILGCHIRVCANTSCHRFYDWQDFLAIGFIANFRACPGNFEPRVMKHFHDRMFSKKPKVRPVQQARVFIPEITTAQPCLNTPMLGIGNTGHDTAAIGNEFANF